MNKPKNKSPLVSLIILCISVAFTIFAIFAVKSDSKSNEPSLITSAANITTVMAEQNTVSEALSTIRFDDNAKISECKISVFDLTDSESNARIKRAVVPITKKQLKNVSADEFLSFLKSVDSSDDYAWLTLICDDKTGIVINGSTNFGVYGKINDIGLISEPYGAITFSESGECVYNVLPKGNDAQNSQSAVSASTESATAKQTETQSEITDETNSNSAVYVTQSGKKFHKAGCSYLNSSKIAIDRSKATADGYEPCSRCKP